MTKNLSPTIATDESRLMAMYAARLARWPVPYESLVVRTRYGKTHIIASGRPDAPPVVLIHAMGVTATMWLPNIVALSRDYRVYALDTIGDLGRSTLDQESLYPKNGRAYSEWLLDVFNEAGIGRAHIIGSSMGGWIAMNHAIHAADRIQRMVLLAPMGLPSLFMTLKVVSQLWSVLLFPTQSNMDKIIHWALGDNPIVREAYTDLMKMGVDSHAKIKLAPPLNLADKQLKKIQSPVLLMLGECDHPIGNARQVSDRAKRFIPQLQVEIIPKAGHLMSTEYPELVNMHILQFLQG